MQPSLEQLRDIHLPAAISWWPPAPGWWLLLAALLLGVVLISAWIRQHRRKRWHRAAMSELRKLRCAWQERDIDMNMTLGALSVLLRRAALSRFPRSEVAALTGEAWLAFLDRPFHRDAPFQRGIGRILVTAPYRRDSVEEWEIDALGTLAERWLRKVASR